MCTERIGKKGDAGGPCAVSGPAQRDCDVCLTTVAAREGSKREESGAKRTGHPLF